MGSPACGEFGAGRAAPYHHDERPGGGSTPMRSVFGDRCSPLLRAGQHGSGHELKAKSPSAGCANAEIASRGWNDSGPRDVRELRWAVGGYLAVVALATVSALGWLGAQLLRSRNAVRGGHGMLLLASLVQADSPTRADAVVRRALLEVRSPFETQLGSRRVLQASNPCTMMRGVEKQNSATITSALRGDSPMTRAEFLDLAHQRQRQAGPVRRAASMPLLRCTDC